MYEHPQKEVAQTLIDNTGQQRNISLPPGSLSQEHLAHLYKISRKVLPAPIAELIINTPQPFLQPIFDCKTSTMVNGRVCLIGDASGVARPHVGVGVLKAIEAAISLAEVLTAENVNTQLLTWNDAQLAILNKHVALAQLMGRELVTAPPDWANMTPDSATQWWDSLMKGQQWYPVSNKADNSAPSANIYTKVYPS